MQTTSSPLTTYTKEEAREATLRSFGGDTLPTDVWLEKYLLRLHDEVYLEREPAEAQRRVARELSRIEGGYPNPMPYEEIESLLLKGRYVIPQGSPMSAIGNPYMVQSLSNCFVIEGAYDSYGGLLFTDQEQAQVMKRRGGVGHDVSRIRPRDMAVSNAARTTAGLGPYLQRFSNTTREVGQDGRRGALMLTCDCRHPEILTFINIKRDRQKVTGANMSVRWRDDFMQAVKDDTEYALRWPCEATPEDAKVVRVVRAREIFDAFVDSAHDSAEPGALYWDTILRESVADCYADVGFETVCTNPCFAPDTMVLTRDGHFPIETLVGRTVEVFDGLHWVTCDNFRVTGTNQPMLRIEMHDGSHTRVTPTHTCVLEDGRRVEARTLRGGERLKISEAPLVHGHVSAPGAYLKGFLLGDGADDTNRRRPLLPLYATKRMCAERLCASMAEVPLGACAPSVVTEPGFTEASARGVSYAQGLVARRDELYPWVEEYRKALPPEVFTWDHRSKCEFIAGMMDADGTASDTRNGWLYQLSGVDKQRLLDFQLLLKTLGVASKLSLMRPATLRDFGQRGGVLATQACWRLTISQVGAIALAKQVVFSRLPSFASKQMSYKIQRKDNVVARVVEDGEEARVYCCTIPSTHSLTLSSGLHWGQCAELPLSAYDSCRLLLLNLMGFVKNPYTGDAFFNYDLFYSYARKAQRLMDDLVDLELEAIERILAKVEADPEPDHVKQVERGLWRKVREAVTNGRRTGLGITLLGDCVAALGIRYGSWESVEFTESVYRELAVASETENIRLAKERGAFPAWRAEAERANPYLSRVHAVIRERTSLKGISPYLVDYEKYGRRSISTTTTAPAGSASMGALLLARQKDDEEDLYNGTSGIEPVAVSLTSTRRRKLVGASLDVPADFVDPSGDRWQEYTVYHTGLRAWMRVTGESDIAKSPYFGATSRDIDWETSVDLQAAAQRWVSHGISKTCNLPENVSKDVVAACYMRAWEKGCKGFTVYREGSRTGVIVAVKEEQAKVDPRAGGVIVENHAPKRPPALPCDIHFTRVKGEQWVVLVGLLAGKPYEVFAGEADRVLKLPRKHAKGTLVKRPKQRRDGTSVYDLVLGEGEDELVVKDVTTTFDDDENGAFTRALSLSMRHGVPIQYIVEQVQRDKHSDFQTFNKVIARVLKKYIVDGVESATVKACEQCGASPLSYQEGCVACRACGWSKCG